MNKYLLKNVHLLDGSSEMEDVVTSVLVNGKIIQAIGQAITDEDLKGAKVIDLTGKYLIPGLINMHVHLPNGGKIPNKPKDSKKLVAFIKKHKCLHFIGLSLGKKYAKESLYSGVTTVRAVGGIHTFDTSLRDKIIKGKVKGPRIICANEAITSEGGHMVGTVSVAAKSVEDAISLVNKRASEGVDFIKIMITGGVIDAKVLGEPGVLRMSKEMVKACCDEAHRLGLKVSAHVESFEGSKVALECGVDTIEHGSDFDPEMLQKFKEHHSALICTFSPALPFGLLDNSITHGNDFIKTNTIVVAKNILIGVKKALENNITIGLGTDAGCPMVEHYNFWRELEWFHQATNVSRKDVLHMATEVNATILGLEKQIGLIEYGSFADMVVLNNNPLDDFSNLKDPYMVISCGKIYKKPRIKKNKYSDENLDNIMKINPDDLLNSII